jgi:hypothetical protein
MMRVWLLLSLTLIGCGKYEVGPAGGLGELKNISPITYDSNSKEFQNIRSICHALESKSTTIAASVNKNFTFANEVKSCDLANYSAIPDSAVTLVSQQDGLKFMENSSYFYFSDVETIQQGNMAAICAQLSNIISPVEQGPNLVYFSTTGIFENDCPQMSNQICIKLEKAVKLDTKDGARARVHTIEWIRFKINDPQRGFFTHKKLISEADCEAGKVFGRISTLKN